MTQRFKTVPMGTLFLCVVILNGYLLFSALDGMRIVSQVEAAASKQLSCLEFYQTRSISAYYDVQHPQQGEALYLFSMAWPLWLILSIGTALGLTALIDQQQRWRWWPIVSMSVLIFLLLLLLPTIAKIGCAIE